MDMLKRKFTGIPVFHGKNHRFLWIQTSFSHLFTNGEAEQRWHIVRHFAKMQRLSLQVAAEKRRQETWWGEDVICGYFWGVTGI